jgi:purine-binding chemotaxis protein CheW
MAELITGFNNSIHQAEAQKEEEQASQYLTFRLAGKLYAVGILDVDEIIEPSDITELPRSPEYIRGVINLRGNVVPVIDLTARLGHGVTAINKRSCIVMVEVANNHGQTQALGMLVDAVNEIVEIGQANIRPAPDMGDSLDTSFIQAMGRVDENFFILLDIQHILSSEQVTRLGQLADHAGMFDAAGEQTAQD